MVQHRFRIRFCKEGDLRLISHRDLARTLERMFRRADVAVSQSEGFHPKPRMSFPAPLALGMAGIDEVLEVDLEQDVGTDELLARLTSQAPPGLRLLRAEILPLPSKKGQAQSLSIEAPVPEAERSRVEHQVAELLARTSWLVAREGRESAIEARPLLEELAIVEGVLRMKLRVVLEAGLRPRDVLMALGLESLETEGLQLTRTAVELKA